MSEVPAFLMRIAWHNKPGRFLRLPVSAFFVLSFIVGASVSYAQDGAKLFKQNCASCHRVDEKKLTGPGLKGVFSRVPSEEWMYKWIKNSPKVIQSGDAYANKIFEEYNKTPMTPQEHLQDADIAAILAYIKNPPVVQKPAPTTIGATAETKDDNSTLIWLAVIAVILLIVIGVLLTVKTSLKNIVNEKHGLPPVPDQTMWESATNWMATHKFHTAMLIFLVFVYGCVKAWYVLIDVAVYQGYAPEQPIKFSHKIHAGENQISCHYCHHSAEKGKTAGIPSVNVCMNCHRGIPEGKQTGGKEIAKIYEAAGWNTETQKYDKPQKPIKWVRVHNLPDFTYFNHSQHVVVGKQECKTCHGKVDEMDVLKQESPLTMMWCINCHRETKVSMEGNAYYDKLHKNLSDKYKDQGLTSFTVDKIGGLECAKCHY